MFNNKEKEQDESALDKEIESVLDRMREAGPNTEEYETLLTSLERLYKLKLHVQSEKKTVSPDALVAAGASIAGIVLILGYEKANVLTSKAMSFVFKPKG